MDGTTPLADQSKSFWRAALLLGLFVCVFMQGSRGIYESTEGRYAECARETITSANPLEPMLNGVNHWTKPPLTYWAIGAGTMALGDNPWGARAYLVLSFLLTVVAVHLLDKALWKGGTRGLSALIFATAPVPIAAAHIISTDMLLTVWEAWALAFYWMAVRSGSRHFTTLMWVALGLAAATKGPVGLIPLTAILPAQWMLKRRGDAPRSVITLEGLLLFALIGLSWFGYVIWAHPEILKQWIGEEVVGRIAYDAHHRASSEPRKILMNYVPMMLFGTGPWLVWWLWKERAQLGRAAWARRFKDADFGVEQVFLALAIVIPFIVFSASSSRLPLYIVPLFAPMCVAIGRGWSHLLDSGRVSGRVVLRIAIAVALLMGAVKGIAAYRTSWKDMTAAAASMRDLPELQGDAPLIALFRVPLNGLQFHLDRRIPTIYFRLDNPTELTRQDALSFPVPTVVGVANTDLLPSSDEDKVYAPEGALVIVRSKELALYGPFFSPLGLEVLSAGEEWSVIRLTQRIDIGEIAEAAPEDDDI